MVPTLSEPVAKPTPTLQTVNGHQKVKKMSSAPDIFWDLEPDQFDMLTSTFGFLFTFVKYSGCYIPLQKEHDIHPVVYYLRWLFIGTASYQTTYAFFYVLFYADYSAMTALTIVELTWSFQSILSIVS
ncbi:hypothetical protein L596_013453 [Steinernema carpocapsae]|uniref:Uncharacterized protein n=2 Tax=Steinernema carpocapsae TaxID=34508 RepID=A0A4U5P0V1_STECR|nr:hypothetical protein L596_013453 [Steinernema carpocapsae]